MSKQASKEELRKAWLAGFLTSGEGFNGEYPYEGETPENASPELIELANEYAEAHCV